MEKRKGSYLVIFSAGYTLHCHCDMAVRRQEWAQQDSGVMAEQEAPGICLPF